MYYYCGLFCFFFFKQKTAYEMRISDWSSDVCSSDLHDHGAALQHPLAVVHHRAVAFGSQYIDQPSGEFIGAHERRLQPGADAAAHERPIEHTRSEERRVGKECVSTCRSRWSLYH